MAKIEGVPQLLAQMKELSRDKRYRSASVIVGFTQAYALHVHEDLEAHHPVGKAKFLEDPFRRLAREIPGIVNQVFRQGKSLAEGLLIAGLRVQRESQLETPVDTGALKASAFTKLEQ